LREKKKSKSGKDLKDTEISCESTGLLLHLHIIRRKNVKIFNKNSKAKGQAKRQGGETMIGKPKKDGSGRGRGNTGRGGCAKPTGRRKGRRS